MKKSGDKIIYFFLIYMEGEGSIYCINSIYYENSATIFSFILERKEKLSIFIQMLLFTSSHIFEE